MQQTAVLLAACLMGPGVEGRGADVIEAVTIVVGPRAAPIEQFAAAEMAEQLKRVFHQINVKVAKVVPDAAGHLVLLGNPDSNPAVADAVGQDWPQISDQGIVIRLLPGQETPTLVVGGGGPTATLWAAYELGHRLGIRYLLSGDAFPQTTRDLDFSGSDLVMEPVLPVRTWSALSELACGTPAWSLADHRRRLHQLAKLKFNRIMFAVTPWQPFEDYQFGGVHMSSVRTWRGGEFLVDGETVGKKVFGGAKLFENPDFAGLTDPQAMTRAGSRHLNGLIETAHELGMTVGISIAPLEFPQEFQPVLTQPPHSTSKDGLTVLAAAELKSDNDVLRGLLAVRVAACIERYPGIDRLCFRIPNAPGWEQHVEEAIDILAGDEASRDGQLQVALAQTVSDKPSIGSQLVALAFLKELLSDGSLFKSSDGRQLGLIIDGVDLSLYPLLHRIIPDGVETVNSIDLEAGSGTETADLSSRLPAANISSQLSIELADDHAGVLPQSTSQRLSGLSAALQRSDWQGFSVGSTFPGESDPTVYYLARAAWDRDLTPRGAQVELWTTMTGNSSAAERLWIGWERLEAATILIAREDPEFAFPADGLLIKHDQSDPAPEWWEQASELYTQYMTELYRAHGAIDGDAKPILFYYAKRSEYALDYLKAVGAVRAAAIAKAADDKEAEIEKLEQAVEATYNCINTLADVARSPSDLGLIAMLNAYAYRPLLDEYQRLADRQ